MWLKETLKNFYTILMTLALMMKIIRYLKGILSINIGEYPGQVKAQGYGLKTAEMAGGIEIEIIWSNCIIIYKSRPKGNIVVVKLCLP